MEKKQLPTFDQIKADIQEESDVAWMKFSNEATGQLPDNILVKNPQFMAVLQIAFQAGFFAGCTVAAQRLHQAWKEFHGDEN